MMRRGLVGDKEGLQHRFNLNNVKIQGLPKWHSFTTFRTRFSRSTPTRAIWLLIRLKSAIEQLAISI